MFKWILTIVCSLASLAYCMPHYLRGGTNRLVWKFSGTSCALPLAVYGAAVHGGRAWLCVAGIAVCAVADVMLEKKFIVGMACFATAHVLYIIWMTGMQKLTPVQPVVWAILLCIVALLLYTWRKPIGSMMVPYIIYGVMVTLMGACAVGCALDGSLAGIIIAVGGLMFVASDSLVCRGTVMRVDYTHHLITMGLYYGAQLCFAAGVALR